MTELQAKVAAALSLLFLLAVYGSSEVGIDSYVAWTGTIAGSVSFAVTAWYFWRHRRPNRSRSPVPLFGALYLLFLPLSAGVLSIYLGAKSAFGWLVQVQLGPWKSAAVVVTAGALLYAFRYRFRSTYGVSEILAGIAISAQKAGQIATPRLDNLEFSVVLLSAGVYLVVRGADNVQQGYERKSDPLAVYLMVKIRERLKPDADQKHEA